MPTLSTRNYGRFVGVFEKDLEYSIDFEEAQHIGVSCQAIIKIWLVDKLIQNEHHKVA